eukprot:3093763-Amphidinium_carterae.1
MRIAYLSLDRADLLESVRHMASEMKEPREGDWVRVKRVGEYLLKHSVFGKRSALSPRRSLSV